MPDLKYEQLFPFLPYVTPIRHCIGYSNRLYCNSLVAVWWLSFSAVRERHHVERNTVMWDLGNGYGLQRNVDLLAEAERERVLNVVRRSRSQATESRLAGMRRKVGLALIRSGEELAGICADPSPRLS